MAGCGRALRSRLVLLLVGGPRQALGYQAHAIISGVHTGVRGSGGRGHGAEDWLGASLPSLAMVGPWWDRSDLDT